MGILNPSPIRIPSDPAAQPQWLANIISEKWQESSTLEYKRGAALTSLRKGKLPKDVVEFSKDIAGLANAGGGLIIYGVAEAEDEFGKKIPKGYDMIPVAQADRESVDQRCRSCITPPIEGLNIVPITPEGCSEAEACVVIEVPQSDRAHQSMDGKYYRRGNATSDFMQDYEVREVMARRTKPDVVAHLSMSYDGSAGAFHLEVTNRGKTLCRFVRAIAVAPIMFGDYQGSLSFADDKIVVDECGKGLGYFLVFDNGGKPLFPGMTVYANYAFESGARYEIHTHELSPMRDWVKLQVFADDMECRERWLHFSEIEVS